MGVQTRAYVEDKLAETALKTRSAARQLIRAKRQEKVALGMFSSVASVQEKHERQHNKLKRVAQRHEERRTQSTVEPTAVLQSNKDASQHEMWRTPQNSGEASNLKICLVQESTLDEALNYLLCVSFLLAG